jgi:hypothetical protein
LIDGAALRTCAGTSGGGRVRGQRELPRPVVDSVYRSIDIRAAYERLECEQQFGGVVVEF